ncbi:MAG: class I SAM-dependent methyltransferase [Nitrospirae bacterium]|nr:class I SAM-dependent methyltransferase [Nitrospirota bacterium]
MERLYRQYKNLIDDEVRMLALQRKIIDVKPILQSMYKSFYSEIERFIPEDGLNVEFGTGHGYTKTYFKNLTQTDRLLTPNIALCHDAHDLPYKDNTLDTILLLGVLHHMSDPQKFFNESKRVLKKGGKILMVEPYISLFSYPVYKLTHPHEKVDLHSITHNSKKYHLLEANLGIPTIFFKKEKEFEKSHPGLRIIYKSYHTIFLFFLSGGYSYPNFLPKFLLPLLLWIEGILGPLGKWLGSMMTIVIQKD